MSTQVMSVSVSGGYNGGAKVEIKLSDTIVFSSVGDSPYNLNYNPQNGSFTSILGEINISLYIPDSRSDLQLRFSGAYENILYVSPLGENSSYGYSYTHDEIFTTEDAGFDIIIQINESEKIRLDKKIKNVLTVRGVLKDITSIIDPVIIIECELSDVRDCNYMTIPVFGRSYFINNIRSVRNGLMEFSCHVDVLSSFKSQIRRNQAIIRKQEKDWNLYLNDGSFRVYQNPNVLTKAFPSGFTTQEFVLAVAGS